jgi:transposase
MGNLNLTHERIDDIPLLISLGLALGLNEAVDADLGTHGGQHGLSNGQLTVGWLAYILSEGDHRKSGVEDWAWRHRKVLSRLFGQPVRRVDFSDDRLGNLLRRFSDTAKWEALENRLWRTSVQVYALETTHIRLDSTTTYGYHQVEEGGVMQHGHSKDHRPDLPQLKLMAALAEPAGQWIATSIVPGQTADDGLYIPLYQRVHDLLGQTGLLYIGDCKMAALETRGQIAKQQDYYLTRLPLNLFSAAQWQAWEAQREACNSLTLFWEEGVLRGAGCEWEHTVTWTEDAEEHSWTERLQWIYSPELAARQQAALETRLRRAETELLALTPRPGRGKRAVRDEETLRTKIEATLIRHKVADYLHPQWERVECRSTRFVGRGRGSATRPTREVVEVYYHISTVERDHGRLVSAQRSLGWELQVTNAPVERVTLAQATTLYREGWHLEHTFHKIKDRPVGLSPLFVWREDQILGLTHLLTLALRLLTLIETQVARGLVAAGHTLTGLYEGQPQRGTQRPTAMRLLRAISHAEITLSEVQSPEHTEFYLTALPSWLPDILAYLKLPPRLYADLAENSP